MWSVDYHFKSVKGAGAKSRETVDVSPDALKELKVISDIYNAAFF